VVTPHSILSALINDKKVFFFRVCNYVNYTEADFGMFSFISIVRPNSTAPHKRPENVGQQRDRACGDLFMAQVTEVLLNLTQMLQKFRKQHIKSGNSSKTAHHSCNAELC